MSASETTRMGYEGKPSAVHASLGEDLWELHAAATKAAEFTAGRSEQDFRSLEVVRAAVEAMLRLMAGAADRIARQSPDLFARLEGTAELRVVHESMQTRGAEIEAIWSFVQDSLPKLMAGAATELERWHEG